MTTAKPNYNSKLPLAAILILAGGLSTRMGSAKAMLKLPSGESLLDYHVRYAKTFNVPIFIADNQQGFTVDTITSSASSRNNDTNFNTGNDTGNVPLIYIEDYQPVTSTQITDKPATDANNASAKQKHSAGPLAGIASALQKLKGCKQLPCVDVDVGIGDWLMVISCDSLINAVDVYQQISLDYDKQTELDVHKQKATVICLQDKQKTYPLLALYHTSLSDSLNAYLDAGERRVMQFINPRCHYVSQNTRQSVSQSISQNVKQPSDSHLTDKDWSLLSNLNTPDDFKIACDIFLANNNSN